MLVILKSVTNFWSWGDAYVVFSLPKFWTFKIVASSTVAQTAPLSCVKAENEHKKRSKKRSKKKTWKKAFSSYKQGL